MKKLTRVLAVIAAAVVLAMGGCDSVTNPGPTGADPAVYVAGYYFLTGSTTRACYWKDGARVDLETIPSQATCIAIVGNDIYIGGFYLNGTVQVACYWKNGVRQPMPIDSGVTGSVVNDIAVSITGQVYFAGYVIKEGNNLACFWTDDEMVLFSGYPDTRAYGITVVGHDVYITGSSGSRLCYWVAGKKYELPITDSGLAWDITVSNGDVYISGWYKDTDGKSYFCYWKNEDKPVKLSPVTNDMPYTGIVVSGSDVIVAGIFTSGSTIYACYWDKTGPHPLTSITSFATCIAMEGNDIYIGGIEIRSAGYTVCYWKNNVQKDLHTDTVGGIPMGIAIKAK
jgi:hypothetical protein